MFPSQGSGNGQQQSQYGQLAPRKKQAADGNSSYEGLRPASSGGFGQARQGSTFGAMSSGQSGGARGQRAQSGQMGQQSQASHPWASAERSGAQWGRQQSAPQHSQGGGGSLQAGTWKPNNIQASPQQQAQVAQPGQAYNFNTGQMSAATMPEPSWRQASPQQQPNTTPTQGLQAAPAQQLMGGGQSLRAGTWSQNDMRGQVRPGGEGLVQQPGQAYNFNTGQMEAERGAQPVWSQASPAQERLAAQPGQVYNFNTGQMENAQESLAPSWSVAEQLDDPLDPYGLRRRQMSQYANFQQ